MFKNNKTVLDQKQITDIFHMALKILYEIGVSCEHKKTIDILSQKGKIKYNSGRICFDKDNIEEHFNNRKSDFAQWNGDVEFSMGGQWHSWELCDPITNRPRLATWEEAIDMAKLSEALGAKGDPIPIAPGNINPRLNTLISEKIALIHTRNLGGRLTATDSEEIKIISQMYKAAGRKYTLGLEGLISPLKINPETMNTYFEWCDDPDIEINIMGIIPMAGATTPLVFPANLSLLLAETLALDYVMHTISDGKLGSIYLRLDPFDFKDGNIVFGSPEWCLYRQVIAELWEGLIGKPMLGGSFRSNSKIVDPQSMMERTASALWQAILGARNFWAVGQLSLDEVYSPVQAVLDKEILKYISSVLNGISKAGWPKDIDTISLVKEGVKDGGFLAHETTVNTFRDMYDFDRLSSYCNLAVWKSRGSITIESKAWDEALKIIGDHDFVLDDVKRKDVEGLYNKGVEYLC